MNLSELNKIEEGIFSSLKNRWNQGSHQTNVQNIFIKDFVQDAITSLNNGIKGGLIDPNIKSNSQSEAPDGEVAATDAEPAGQEFKWAPKGMKIDPNTKLSSMGAVGNLAETEYNKLNQIFESIINLDEEEQHQLRTITDYMMDWFGQYMRGVEWESSKAIVQQRVDKLQDEYPKNINANLQALARMGLALSKTATPAGAPAEFVQAKKEQIGSVQELKAALDSLATSDPNVYNLLLRSLRPVSAA